MTFRITGPGEYRTRDGRKAVVLGEIPAINNICTAYKYVGYFAAFEGAWEIFGKSIKGREHDIISVWQEPVVVEGWVNVCEHKVFETEHEALEESCGLHVTCRKIHWDGSKIVDVTGEVS